MSDDEREGRVEETRKGYQPGEKKDELGYQPPQAEYPEGENPPKGGSGVEGPPQDEGDKKD